jgi:hypothetical protein
MGRQLMKMGREKMAEEAARTAERMLNERTQREEAELALHNRSRNVSTAAAVSRGLLGSIVGSLASEDITPYIDVQPVELFSSLEAWTDFHQIHIRYHQDPDPRIMAAVLRGLMYHEGGHIRWTIPFAELREMAGVSAQGTGEEMRRLQRAWNALEDQRMETAVVSDSPNKAGFFVPMVMMELLNTVDKATMNYPLLVWRRYLPKHIRDACRAAFVAFQGGDEHLTLQIEQCVDDYVKATTAWQMWAAVCWFAELTNLLQMTLPQAAETHSKQKSTRQGADGETQQSGPAPAEKMEIPIDPTQDASPAGGGDEDEQPAEEAGGEAGGEQEGEGESAAAGGEGGEEGDGEGGDEGAGDSPDSDATSGESTQGAEGSGAGARSEDEANHDPLSQEMLNEAMAQAEDDRYNSRSLDADVDAFNDALDRRGSKLGAYTLHPEEDVDRLIAADALADDLVGSFNQATMDRIPSWVEGQRSGRLNVGRYMTRQPGDMEYFTQWMDDDVPGYNLAVSVLLDYSGSMSRSAQDLAQAGYAVKTACQRLDIPCTVVLWDDDAKVLWDGEEEADMLPRIVCTGNTDPTWALADLDNQRFNKVRHLVLIMTDGVWSGYGDRTLAPYCIDGRMMMGIGYALDDEKKAQGRTAKLIGYGCPDAFPITNLQELPWLLEEYLIRMA